MPMVLIVNTVMELNGMSNAAMIGIKSPRMAKTIQMLL
jgi:hypothetical protein